MRNFVLHNLVHNLEAFARELAHAAPAKADVDHLTITRRSREVGSVRMEKFRAITSIVSLLSQLACMPWQYRKGKKLPKRGSFSRLDTQSAA